MVTYRMLLLYCTLVLTLFPVQQVISQAAKGQSMRMHSIPLKKKNKTLTSPDKPLIGFVSLRPYTEAVPEVKLAFNRLKNFGEYTAEFLTFKEFVTQMKKNSRFSAIWIHRADTAAFAPAESDSNLINALKTYVDKGGSLWLTLQAAHYINLLGFETVELQDSTKICIDEGYGRRLGFHAFREHPLFDGLNGGAYICRPTADISSRITGFFGVRLPRQGKVIAVDWDYIFLREDSRLVLEYNPGKGKVLAVGGYMKFSIPSSNAEHLSLFSQNCLNYLTGRYKGQKEFYWDYSPVSVLDCLPRPETDQLLRQVPQAAKWEMNPFDIALKRLFASDNFWDVAGERMLTMGSEQGGIEEVWAHPFMAFRDYEVGISFDYNDTVYWLNDERPQIEVDPAYFARQYKFPRAYLREVVVNDPDEPNGVIHYEYRGVYGARLTIRFKSNLRWMWPYSERVTGSICHSWDSDLRAISIQDKSGDLNVMIGGNKEPFYHLTGQFDGFTYVKKDSTFNGVESGKLQIAGLLTYELEMNDNLDIVYSASIEGYGSTKAQFEKTLRDPGQVYHKARQHCQAILDNGLMITTPDKNFNAGYQWSLIATDRFFVNTPGMGKALVAGYSTTRHGWDGGHKVNGRPGYGWYFGRDAEWSSFALLDYGDFDKVKSQLEFFNKYQDLNGKIFHEASTSGLIHYDAADATPLYIVLAGKYFRHTNDTAFLRKTWPNVKRAINFCFSTDTDRDHLIENTNVGHGWVEGGELYGSHATVYMAGAWGAAMNEAFNMALFMQDGDAEKYHQEAEMQKKSVISDFWNDKQQFFAYGKNKDGSFRTEQTILPAVPIYFGMADHKRATIALKSIAGNNFSTNWGVRILREDSPWFKPTGYHYGSVWPLFTGWASLAEYSTGNSIQGFSHLMNNLNIHRNWGLGFIEEVMNGAFYQPSGVCAHQCWSETMVLQPAIEGLLGLEVRAQERKIILAPQMPPQWDSLDIRHVLMGDQAIDLHFTRKNGKYEFSFSLDKGKPVNIEFMPSLPAGSRIGGVTLNGTEVPLTSFKSSRSITLSASFELASACRLIIEAEGGISVLPAVTDPKPGDPSEGMRILADNLSGSLYEVEVEGKSGSTGILEFWCGGRGDYTAENARFLDRSGQIFRFTVDFERSESRYLTKTVIVNLE